MRFRDWYGKVKPKDIHLSLKELKELIVKSGYEVVEIYAHSLQGYRLWILGIQGCNLYCHYFGPFSSAMNISWRELGSTSQQLRFVYSTPWFTAHIDEGERALESRIHTIPITANEEQFLQQFVEILGIEKTLTITSPEEMVYIPTLQQLIRNPTIVTKQRKFVSEAKKEWHNYFEKMLKISRSRLAGGDSK